jgi:type IV secretory pathway VirD2 relaxase
MAMPEQRWGSSRTVTEERPFRLRPHKPRHLRDESKTWARGFQQLMHLVRMTTKPLAARLEKGTRRYGTAGFASSRHNQRCAVSVSYTRNKTRGQWAAHGRYIVRESATVLRRDGTAAFGSLPDATNLPQALAAWQRSGDERVFKVILSPEFGERLDLEGLTREVMKAVEDDVGRRLEWAAVVHRNTEHPHVHIVVRGVAGGEPLRFPREYVQHGMRRHAESACTVLLGYRTRLDREEAERREVSQARFTSLDRILSKARPGDLAAPAFAVSPRPDEPGLGEFAHSREQRLVARLNYLTQIGIAERTGPLSWNLRSDFETALRAFQRAHDRQKMLAQHAAFLSDPRLQYRVLTPDSTKEIVGRMVAHVLDEASDRPHALIEGVDGVVYYVAHDAAIAEARANGKLKPNAFVQLRNIAVAGRSGRVVDDFGDAERFLANRALFKTVIGRLLQRGMLDDQRVHWSGWLGRYHEVLREESGSRRGKLHEQSTLHRKTERGR